MASALLINTWGIRSFHWVPIARAEGTIFGRQRGMFKEDRSKLATLSWLCNVWSAMRARHIWETYEAGRYYSHAFGIVLRFTSRDKAKLR